MDLQEVRVGDSIAVNGACLTVTARGDRGFTADVSAETLERTNLRMLKTGDRVNLEKAMRLNDFLGGHLVLGHVDGLGRVQEITRKANSLIFGIETDAKLLRYVVEKGFIAVDGVSLTVVAGDRSSLAVSLVGFTLDHTVLGSRKIGDQVNLEVDILAKYIEKLGRGGGGVTLDFLSEHGFTSTRPGA